MVNCDLKEEIRLMELQLNKLIEKNEDDLSRVSIINYSKALDKIILKYQLLNTT